MNYSEALLEIQEATKEKRGDNKMENLKFRTSSNEETLELLKYLQELGYSLSLTDIDHKIKRNIYAHDNGHIYFNICEYDDTIEAFISYRNYKHCRFIKKTIYSHEEIKEEVKEKL